MKSEKVLLITCLQKELLLELEYRWLSIEGCRFIEKSRGLRPGSKIYFVDGKAQRGYFKVSRTGRVGQRTRVYYFLDSWKSDLRFLSKELKEDTIITKSELEKLYSRG